MADRPKVGVESYLQDTGSGSIGLYRVPQWSTSDTITMSDFTTVSAATAYRADTLASVTVSVATNIITLTQAALTNIKVYVVAVGTR